MGVFHSHAIENNNFWLPKEPFGEQIIKYKFLLMLNHVDFRFVTNETKRCFIDSYLHNLHFPFCS